MCTRRYSDPVYLQYIWDAIEGSADRICDFDSILEYIRNHRDPKCDVIKLRDQLGNALRDRCVTLSGSQYRKSDWSSIPTSSEHDSYCFQCHMPGSVVDCPTCFRVYHESCFKRAFETKTFITFPDERYQDDEVAHRISSSCPTCRHLSNTHLDKTTTFSDLRAIYSVALEKMRGKLPWRNLYTVGYMDDVNRNRYFSFKQMNTRIMTDKLRNGSSTEGYRNRTHILADLDLLIHNAAVIYGSKAEMTNTARQIRSLVQRELRESSLCVDCYLRSKGGKPDQRQIVEACRRPHKLIWFQYSSWSFRPCKVLHRNDDGYEVICFDGRRERQFVPLKNAVTMSFSASHLGMRITAPLKRALVDARRYVENQQKITPDFTADEGLMLSDISSEPQELKYPERNTKNTTNSSRSSVKRSRVHDKEKSSSQPKTSSNKTGTESVKSGVDKSRVSVSSLSTPCDSFRTGPAVPRMHRLSNNHSSLSDSDDNSTNSSSSSDSSDSDPPLAKRPNYRSVAIPPASKRILPSISSDSTSSVTENVDSSNRPFLSRPVVTDSDSDSASSPLGSGSLQSASKIFPPISRRRDSSSGSTASGGTVVESDSSLGKNSSILDRRMFSSSTKCNFKGLSKSLKEKKSESLKSQLPEDLVSTCSALGNSASTSENSKNNVSEKDKKSDATFNNNISTAPKLPLGTRAVAENGSTKRNPLPPVSAPTPSVSSVSPAALSSSSGIGSILSGDAKSVEASPGDLLCNGHSGAVHTDSSAIRTTEGRAQQSTNETIESLKLERDKANKRLQELEQYIQDLEKKYNQEIINTKRFSWCRICLNKAVYYCCAGAAYCSHNCQKKDWFMGHSEDCRRVNDSSHLRKRRPTRNDRPT